MTATEMSNQFDVLFNNITSNQAPGLNEYEKSVFLTKAQDEIVKNYFLSQSNPKQAGFDDNQKRQIDFSNILCSGVGIKVQDTAAIDPRAVTYRLPGDMLFVINEVIQIYDTISWSDSFPTPGTLQAIRQVIPISYAEYMRLMSKPFKEPLKYQAWRLMVDTSQSGSSSDTTMYPNAEILITTADKKKYGWNSTHGAKDPNGYMLYALRYVRKPHPIILVDLSTAFGEDLSIGGMQGKASEDIDWSNHPCELTPAIHEEILQRAVELAKVAWTATGQENTQLMIEAGKRSE